MSIVVETRSSAAPAAEIEKPLSITFHTDLANNVYIYEVDGISFLTVNRILYLLRERNGKRAASIYAEEKGIKNFATFAKQLDKAFPNLRTITHFEIPESTVEKIQDLFIQNKVERAKELYETAPNGGVPFETFVKYYME